MQLLTTQMLTKKDSAIVLVVGSTSIVEPDSVANVVPFTKVEPHADLHMRKVSESPPCLSLGSLAALPRSPSHSQSQGDSSESSLDSAPT